MDELKPKHIIRDEAKFQKDRAKMGNFIVEGMETTGGTDIDWMIEHRGGFIIDLGVCPQIRLLGEQLQDYGANLMCTCGSLINSTFNGNMGP